MLSKSELDKLRVNPGEKVNLADHATDWLPKDLAKLDKDERKKAADQLLEESREELSEAQDKLYASDTHSLLLVFQAMDAAGKDSTIKHVFSGVNPQGCSVTSFKQPSKEELDHNFLWRIWKAVPERGMIGIFNRSHYEEVLVCKVHPDFIAGQHIPNADPAKKSFWEDRYADINNFEAHLARNGTKVVKFFLNVSKDEQAARFLARIDDPTKNWKFSSSDLKERALWDEYQKAYEQALTETSTEDSPWYVIPADRKWAMRALVANIITATINELDAQYPVLDPEEAAKLAESKQSLEAEGYTSAP